MSITIEKNCVQFGGQNLFTYLIQNGDNKNKLPGNNVLNCFLFPSYIMSFSKFNLNCFLFPSYIICHFQSSTQKLHNHVI